MPSAMAIWLVHNSTLNGLEREHEKEASTIKKAPSLD